MKEGKTPKQRIDVLIRTGAEEIVGDSEIAPSLKVLGATDEERRVGRLVPDSVGPGEARSLLVGDSELSSTVVGVEGLGATVAGTNVGRRVGALVSLSVGSGVDKRDGPGVGPGVSRLPVTVVTHKVAVTESGDPQ